MFAEYFICFLLRKFARHATAQFGALDLVLLLSTNLVCAKKTMINKIVCIIYQTRKLNTSDLLISCRNSNCKPISQHKHA